MKYGIWCNECGAFERGLLGIVEYDTIAEVEAAIAASPRVAGVTYRPWPIFNGEPYFDGIDPSPSDA
jgi:hypothetical protein